MLRALLHNIFDSIFVKMLPRPVLACGDCHMFQGLISYM